MSTIDRTYRVIHHDKHGETRDLGELVAVPPHPSALELFAGALLRAGQGGRLELVEAASGRTVARRAVRPLPRRGGQFGTWGAAAEREPRPSRQISIRYS